MKNWIVSAIVAAVALTVPASAAGATATGDWVLPVVVAPSDRVVEVVNRLPGWYVRQSVGFVDRYTASRVRFVAKCSGKSWRCLTIRSGKVSGAPVGWRKGSTITIDTAKAKRYGFAGSKQFRRYMVAHEVGHFYGLGHEDGRNTMNPNSKYRGKYLPLLFDKGQVKYLAGK